VLRLLFSDGTVGEVDLSADMWTGILEPLKDPAFFAQVTVDAWFAPVYGRLAAARERVSRGIPRCLGRGGMRESCLLDHRTES
jgi:hypothetical protein